MEFGLLGRQLTLQRLQLLLVGEGRPDGIVAGEARTLQLEPLAQEIGAGRTGLRLSPMTTFTAPLDSDPQALYGYVVEQLAPLGLAFLHIIEGETGGPRAPEGKAFDYEALHRAYPGAWLVNNGYTRDLALNQATLYAGYPHRFRHFRKTGGYANMPLDGIWLRAPYLHNGSVPSLRDLLEPAANRPPSFYRGNDVYDPVKVGFVSDLPEANGRKFFRLDTTLPGNGNGAFLQAKQDIRLLIAGLEVHQQLLTERKMFCHCPARRYTADE